MNRDCAHMITFSYRLQKKFIIQELEKIQKKRDRNLNTHKKAVELLRKKLADAQGRLLKREKSEAKSKMWLRSQIKARDLADKMSTTQVI